VSCGEKLNSLSRWPLLLQAIGALPGRHNAVLLSPFHFGAALRRHCLSSSSHSTVTSLCVNLDIRCRLGSCLRLFLGKSLADF
jgi:hypothetical protein